MSEHEIYSGNPTPHLPVAAMAAVPLPKENGHLHFKQEAFISEVERRGVEGGT